MGGFLGCSNSKEITNLLLMRAINENDFFEMHRILLITQIHELDPTFIHEAVKTGNIDIIDLFIDKGRLIRFQIRWTRFE